MAERLARKLLLIGWDGADWKLIHPLLDQGLMPALEGLVSGGVIGNLGTLRPILSPLVWNSISTGKLPDKHGVLNFIEPDPVTGGVRPVASSSRKVKALWNILTQQGLRAHVVAWYAGHPAEPINGVAVSPLYAYATAPKDKPWPLPEGAIHPASLRDTLAELRIHPGEIGEAEVLPFVPRGAEIDQEKDKRLDGLVRTLAQCCTVHNAATWILEHEEWDFLAVYYEAIDHFCHGFAQFHPPRMEAVPEEQFEIYKEVVTGAYRFHDMMLERLLKLAGPEATIVLVSDHGFHSDHLRPRGIPREPAGPAVWHRPYGVICLKGPHIRRDERIYGATVLDVTPTVLTLFGLPVGQDMDGKVLVQAFEEPKPPETIPSWEEVPGECGMHPAEMRMDPEATKALIDQFVALGYLEPPSEDQSKAVALALRETRYNLAQMYLDSRRPALALPVLQQLVEENPDVARFKVFLARCYVQLGRRQEAFELLEPLLEREKERPWAQWIMGLGELVQAKPEEAVEHLLKAEEAERRLPTLHIRLGHTYLRMRQLEDAARAFARAIEIDPDSPQAHLGMAMTLLRQRRNEEAVQEALEAVGLQHFFPSGHYFLGVALARLGHFDRAMLAFQTAVSMQPGMAAAHRWLSVVYLRAGDIGQASLHRAKAMELRRRREARADGLETARGQD